jgi:hypothetical protein
MEILFQSQVRLTANNASEKLFDFVITTRAALRQERRKEGVEEDRLGRRRRRRKRKRS